MRNPALIAAAGGSLAVGTLLMVLAMAALAAGHGEFSGGVGAVLLVYGLAVAAAGVWLGRGSLFARGPVLALGLLNLAVAASYAGDVPWAWLVVAAAAVSVVGAALPATTRALRRGDDSAEATRSR